MHCYEHLGKLYLTHLQMWNLYRDPSGTKIIDGRYPSGHSEQQTTNEITVMTHNNDQNVSEKVDKLSAEVKELKKMLETKNEHIKGLEAKIETKEEPYAQ